MTTIFNYIVSYLSQYALDLDNPAQASFFLVCVAGFGLGLICLLIKLISKIKSFALFGS